MTNGTEDSEMLVAEAAFPWPDGDSYAILNARLTKAGAPPLGPHSTMAEVRDAMFDIQSTGAPGARETAAWHGLRVIEKRLVIDFFHYRVPRADLTPLQQLADLPLPVERLDVANLVAARLEEVAHRPQPAPLPPVHVDWRLIDAGTGPDRPPPAMPRPHIDDVLGD